MADVSVYSYDDVNMIDTPMWMQAPIGETAYPYSANGLRYLMRGWRASAPSGVGAGGDFRCTQGGGRTVDVAKGLGVVFHSDNPEERYSFGSFGTVNIAAPAHTSGTQYHRVVAQVLDKQIPGMTSGDSCWRLMVVEGTGGVAPDLPACSIPLAQITDTGQVDILNGDLTDQREPFDHTSPTLSLGRPAAQSISRFTRTAITVTHQYDDDFNVWHVNDPTKIYLRHPGTYSLFIQAFFPDLYYYTDVIEAGFSANGLSDVICSSKAAGQGNANRSYSAGSQVDAIRVGQLIVPGAGYYVQPYVWWNNVAAASATNVTDVLIRVQRIQYRTS